MGLPKGEEREKREEEIFAVIMAEYFLGLMTDTKPQFQENQGTPRKINTKKFTSRHIIFKLQKTLDKEKILKEARERKNTLLTEEQDKNTQNFSL